MRLIFFFNFGWALNWPLKILRLTKTKKNEKQKKNVIILLLKPLEDCVRKDNCKPFNEYFYLLCCRRMAVISVRLWERVRERRWVGRWECNNSWTWHNLWFCFVSFFFYFILFCFCCLFCYFCNFVSFGWVSFFYNTLERNFARAKVNFCVLRKKLSRILRKLFKNVVFKKLRVFWKRFPGPNKKKCRIFLCSYILFLDSLKKIFEFF